MGMIPIGDDNSGQTVTPLVNSLLIAANIAVFVLLQGGLVLVKPFAAGRVSR